MQYQHTIRQHLIVAFFMVLIINVVGCSSMPSRFTLDPFTKPSVSRDGGKLLVQVFRASTKERYTLLFNTKDRVFSDLESLDGNNSPNIDYSGTRIVTIGPDEDVSRVKLYDIASRSSQDVSLGSSLVKFPIYNPVDDALYYFSRSHPKTDSTLLDYSLVQFSFSTGAVREIRSHIVINGPISISPDGLKIGFSERAYTGAVANVINLRTMKTWKLTFASSSELCFLDDKTVVVNRIGKIVDRKIDLEKNSSVIRWDFETDSIDNIFTTKGIYQKLSWAGNNQIYLGDIFGYLGVDVSKRTVFQMLEGTYTYIGQRASIFEPIFKELVNVDSEKTNVDSITFLTVAR